MAETDSLESQEGIKHDSVAGKWIEQITAARKRDEKYRKRTREVVEIYESEESRRQDYNILYANTQILQPSIYAQPPKAVVKPKYKNLEPTPPISVQAAQYGQAILQQLIDTGENDRTSLHSACEAATEHGLVTDRGVVRVKYDAETEDVPQVDPLTGEALVDAAGKPVTAPILLSEMVDFEVIEFDSIVFGYSSTWNTLPWLAFRHVLTKDEIKRNFGEDIAAKIKFTAFEYTEEDERREADNENKPSLGVFYEVWDKKTKSVLFVSPGYPKIVKKVPDPLELEGFFPMPEPLSFGRRFGKGKAPIPLYWFYERQAMEINELTRRIHLITKAVKVRGLYDKEMGGLETLLSADDNAMIPVDNMAAISAATGSSGGFDKSIWFLPLETLVNALNTLVMQRQNAVQVTYEITGIGDIMRGTTKASETLGAQEIKSQFGSTRLKRLQNKAAIFVRDLLRLSAEVVVKKFSPDTIAKMISNSPQQLDMALLTATLDSMRKDYVRNFNIDIETNSTVGLETAGEKEEVMEFIQALGALITGGGPAVESGALPFKAFKGILSHTVKKFRFGQELEQILDELPDELPKKDDGEREKAQLEREKQQFEMQRDKDKHAQEMQRAQMTAQLERERMQRQQQVDMQKMALEERRHRIEMEELEANRQVQAAERAAKLEIIAANVAAAKAKATARPQQQSRPRSN